MSLRILLLLTAASLVGAPRAIAQGFPEWLIYGGDVGSPTAIYFYDAAHGVVAVSDGILYISAPKYQWHRAPIPLGITGIRSIRNIQGKLYAVTDADVLVSSDSGHSWSYSGLGLTHANDVYADGTGKIRTLQDPMKVFARIDTMHCVAQGSGSVFVSSDGGVTWTNSGLSMDPGSFGATGDPCHGVFLCPSSGSTVLRSVDAGQTWQSIVAGPGGGPEYLVGSGVTNYIIGSYTPVRSTNGGQTWTNLYTGTPLAPLYVFGPMGEHVIGHGRGLTMAMTSTGGMDDLHSGPDISDSNGMPLAQQDTLNMPLRITSHCNAMTIGLPFRADVDSMYETVTVLKDSLGDFALTQPTTKLLRRGHEDTVYIAYNPHHLVGSVTIKVENHWNCSDWSETHTVMVTSLPSASIYPPPPLAGNCRLAREAAYLKLDSCTAMIIDSVQIPERLQARLKFEHELPDTVSKGAGDSLYFTWDPRDTLTTIFDSVQVFAHYEGVDSALWWWDWRSYLGNDTAYPPLSQFNRTLPITLYALPNVALITSDSAIEFRALRPCERVQDTVISVINAGCTSDTVLTVNLRGAGFEMDPVTTPFIVPPDSAMRIHVRFIAPTDSSDRHGAIDLWVLSGESKTVTIPLSGVGFTSHALFTMSNTVLGGDSSEFCLNEVYFHKTLRDTLRNGGCDTIFFGSITNVSDTAFHVGTLPPFLAPNDSLVIPIEFSTRVKGAHIDTLHLEYSLGRAAMIDTSIIVSGFVYHGESYLDLSVGGIDFPALYSCQTMDTTVQIINAGCDTLYVDSIHFLDPSSFVTPTRLPIIVPPNDTLPLVIRVSPNPSSGGNPIRGDATIFSEASSFPVRYFPLSVLVNSPEDITIQLVGGPAKGHAGDNVRYALAEGGDLKTPRRVHFALTNSDDLLDSTSFAGNNLRCDSTVRGANGEITRYFTVTVSDASDTAAIFNYTVALTDSGTTNVRLSDLSVESVNGLPGACVTSLSASGLSFTYDPYCGEDFLIHYLAGGGVSIESIRPNPAKTQIELHVVSADTNQEIHISAFDLLGRHVQLKPASNAMTYDVSALPEGVYYIEAKLGEARAVRQLIIQR